MHCFYTQELKVGLPRFNIQRHLQGHCDIMVVLDQYTLLQKKRNFSEPIFAGDPGSLTLTPGPCWVYMDSVFYLAPIMIELYGVIMFSSMFLKA